MYKQQCDVCSGRVNVLVKTISMHKAYTQRRGNKYSDLPLGEIKSHLVASKQLLVSPVLLFIVITNI